MKYVYGAIAVALAFVLAFNMGEGSKISDMTVVQAIAADRENGEYLLTVQYLDLNRGSGKTDGLASSLTSNAQGRGSTLKEAYTNLKKTLPDSLFFGQAKIIVLSEKLSPSDIKAIKDELYGNKKFRTDMLVSQSKTAYTVLECGFRNERVPIDGICKELRRENALVFVNELEGNNAQLPKIVINGDSGYVIPASHRG